jgi:integrase
MASIVNDPNGRKRISFRGTDGKRRTLRLGVVSDDDAGQILQHVEAILHAGQYGLMLPGTTAGWLQFLPDDFHARVVAAGLDDPRQPVATAPLGQFLEQYLARRDDLKPASLLVVKQVVRNLRAFFGDDRDMATVNAAEADDFRRWLDSHEKLSPATVGKRLTWASTFFRDAMLRKLIPENPFSHVKRPGDRNPDRQRYIESATIAAVIEAAPDAEWRLLIALARFLGLRVPSEPFSLKWEDVDRAKGRIRVTSPKTSRYQGRGSRLVPILPELEPFLADVFDQAPEGAVYVLHNLRARGSVKSGFWADVNLRTRFEKIIRRAGHEPWPKLWHNLRASAQTDLANQFPAHVVCAWLGNSEAIARDHYLQVTDDHFTAALGRPADPPEATRIPTRAGAEIDGNRRIDAPSNEKTPVKQGFPVKGWRVGDLNP